MKKTISAIMLVLAVMLCSVFMGIFVAACESNQSEFTITVVYSDGTPVDGTKDPLKVQICSAASCYNDFPVVDADGKVTFNIETIENALSETTFILHVLDSENIALQLESEVTVNRSNPTVTVKLANRTAD